MGDWVIPYIMLPGTCDEALTFYQQAFGGELTVMRYGDAPANPDRPMPEELRSLVLFAELHHQGHRLRFCDTPSSMPYTIGNHITLSIDFATPEETRAVYAHLAEGATIDMPLAPTFFSPLYAMLTDRYGLRWHLITQP